MGSQGSGGCAIRICGFRGEVVSITCDIHAGLSAMDMIDNTFYRCHTIDVLNFDSIPLCSLSLN